MHASRRREVGCHRGKLRLRDNRRSRKALRVKGLLAHFGRYEVKDYNAAITDLLKAGKLQSSTGKSRINDEVLLSRLSSAAKGS